MVTGKKHNLSNATARSVRKKKRMGPFEEKDGR
jgi:hypothetical protein